MPRSTDLACACGKFHLELVDDPFITAECHCNSCRSAAQRLATLPVSRPMAVANGGTPYVLYRKDRIRFPDGTAPLGAFLLSDSAKTRRLLATCCNTPVAVEFEGGHWLSVYASLWPESDRPPMQIRTQTGDAPDSAVMDSTLPSGAMTTAGFYGKLLWAWIAMGFKVSKIAVEQQVVA